MTYYDYAVIVFYLGFMFFMGPVFKSFSKTASDFYRCGGGLLWWVAGSSTFMTTFTAWSFMGLAEKAYETGTFCLQLHLCNIVGLIFTFLFTAARFRQMRVVTETEAIRKRYGNVNEQVFTWLPIISTLALGGVYLYTISKFMNGVFGMEVWRLIVGLGGVVMLMTLFGGSWAAIAGDIIQMLIVLTITCVMAFLTLRLPQIDGLANLIKKLPETHFDWTAIDRPGVLLFFFVTLMLNQMIQNNSMSTTGGAKYIFVKNGQDARKAALVSMCGFIFLPWIWIIPAMAATIVFPNLRQQFPGYPANVNETAYVAMAKLLLPRGLLGLLVCAVFAGTLTTLCSYLNVASGVFVRNFYIRIVDKNASESKQIMIGRFVIFLNGIAWMLLAYYFSETKWPLFDLLLTVSASIGLPMTIPLFYGIFFKKTPPWAAWSTMAAGMVPSIILRIILRDAEHQASFFNAIFSPASPFSAQEIKDLNIGFTTGVLFFICTAWYFGTMLFYRKDKKEYVKQVDDFFTEMNTPIDKELKDAEDFDNDARQYVVLGNLCMIYGAFVLSLLFIPNEMQARLCIVFCGLTIGGAGLIIRAIGAHKRRNLQT
jgi:SSS family solute:Na+ symporter